MSGLSTMFEALETGQFDDTADSGHTPDEAKASAPSQKTEQVEGRDDGHTPSDRTVEPKQPKEEGAQDEPTKTPDAATAKGSDTSEEASEEETSGKTADGGTDGDFFFKGKHSSYRTKEEYDRAVDVKDELLFKERQRSEEAERQLAEARALLNQQNELLPEDQRKAIVMRTFVAEALGSDRERILGMTEEDLASDEEARDILRRAEIKAEMKYEQQVAEANKKSKAERETRAERLKAAENFVRDSVVGKEKDFGAHTVEDRIRLGQFFDEKPGDIDLNRAEVAVLLYDQYGQEAAEVYLDGLKSRFGGNQAKEVAKVVEKAQPKPEPPVQKAAPTKTRKEPMDPYQTMEYAFAQSGNSRQ